MKFTDLVFSDRGLETIQAKVFFANGFGASIVKGPNTYGGEEGLYELAILHDGKLVYDTPITNDVLGWLTEADVIATLQQIELLESR